MTYLDKDKLLSALKSSDWNGSGYKLPTSYVSDLIQNIEHGAFDSTNQIGCDKKYSEPFEVLRLRVADVIRTRAFGTFTVTGLADNIMEVVSSYIIDQDMRLVAKDQEIIHLKDEIKRGDGIINQLRGEIDHSNVHEAKLHMKVVNLEKLCDMQKGTIDALREARKNALKDVLSRVTKMYSETKKSLDFVKDEQNGRLCALNNVDTLLRGMFQQPAQKAHEPELFICPEARVCKPSTCFHNQPHTHGSGCMRPSDSKCHVCSDCIPVKEPVSQPSPVPTSGTGTAPEGATISQKHDDAIDAAQYVWVKHPLGKGDLDYSGMAKDIGDLTLRVDNLERTIKDVISK